MVSLIALVFWNTYLNSDGITWQYGTFMWMVRLTLGTPVASFTKEVELQFGKHQLKNNGHIANLMLTSLVKEASNHLNTIIKFH